MQANSKFYDVKTQFKDLSFAINLPIVHRHHLCGTLLAKSVYTRPFANLAAQVPKKVAFLTGRIFARLSDLI